MDALEQFLKSLLVSSPSPSPSSSSSSLVVGCPYFLLLQHGLDLKQRISAADHSSSLLKSKSKSKQQQQQQDGDDENVVYSLAGLATPQECGIHQLQSYSKVMKFITEQALLLQQQQQHSIHILSIQCLGPSSFIHSNNKKNNCTIVDFYSDPCGWDTNDNDDSDESDDDDGKRMVWKGEIQRLSRVWKTLQDAIMSIAARNNNNDDNVMVVMMWDSLTPILLLHGLKKTLTLLQRIKTSSTTSQAVQLMVYPVLTETLTDHSNAQLEDISDAVITTQKHNTILYRPTSITQHLSNPNSRIHTRGGMTKFTKHILSTANPPPTNTQHNQHTTTNTTTNTNNTTNNSDSLQQLSTTDTTTTTTSTRKSSLLLSHETTSSNVPTTTTYHHPTETNKNMPRIYMQDNDIEFDDLDDEDVDDDLDI